MPLVYYTYIMCQSPKYENRFNRWMASGGGERMLIMKICERCKKKNQKFSLFCLNAPVVKFIFISKNLTPNMHRIVLLPLGAVVLTLEGYFLS